MEENTHVGYYLIAGVQRVGKSMHHLGAVATAAAKQAKFMRRLNMHELRKRRTEALRIEIQEYLTKGDPESLCFGCELESTFCEGARCEYQEEVFFEQYRGRKNWKKLIYDVMGKDYYSLSMRSKLNLLKNLN